VGETPAPRRVVDNIGVAQVLDRRKVLWIEFGVVMTLAVLPGIWFSTSDHFWPHYASNRVTFLSVISGVFYAAATVAPIVFILWVSGDDLSQFGLGKFIWWRGLPAFLGALLFSLLAHSVLVPYFRSTGLLPTAATPRLSSVMQPGLTASWMLSIRYVFAGFAEEIVFRSYLIPRLRELLGSTAAALALSSALFAIGHLYEGVGAVFLTFLTGLGYGVAFLMSRSVWPGTAAHVLGNIIRSFVRLT
jgi:membrane protease YdiL (CAAX protease family)